MWFLKSEEYFLFFFQMRDSFAYGSMIVILENEKDLELFNLSSANVRVINSLHHTRLMISPSLFDAAALIMREACSGTSILVLFVKGAIDDCTNYQRFRNFCRTLSFYYTIHVNLISFGEFITETTRQN